MRHSIPTSFCLFLVISMQSVTAQMIVAHRGASHDAPENTLAAFELAWQQGADAIEGDFYLTSDQKIICVHDKDTKRVCPEQSNRKISQTDFDTLRSLDVGRWKDPRFAGEKMPSLSEVLKTVPAGKKVFVEIKTGPEILPVLQKDLGQSNLRPEQITLICFNADVIRQARTMMPQYHANWLTSYKERGFIGKKSWSPTVNQVIKTLRETGSTGFGTQGNQEVIDAGFVAAVKEAGFGFHVWTVNDPQWAAKLKSMGAMSLTTDRPQFIRNALERATKP